MGLDIYAGPLTRYCLGDWELMAQRIAAELGWLPVVIVRSQPEADDATTDPAVMLSLVLRWRDRVASAVGLDLGWPEGADLPYETDKPDWAGYGAVLLLAAYSERPDLRPRHRTRLGRMTRNGDDPEKYADSRAYRAVVDAEGPHQFSALYTAQWFLPVSRAFGLRRGAGPNGVERYMASVGQLYDELVELNRQTLRLGPSQLDAAFERGPVDLRSVQSAAPWGISVMLRLAEWAMAHRQPLLLDW